MNREYIFWKNHFQDFLISIDEDSKKKILWILLSFQTIPRIPIKFFKHIEGTDGLFELRITWERKAYRIFCFFDKGNKIILCNAFIKKDQKTPKSEIQKALKIREDYFHEKSK